MPEKGFNLYSSNKLEHLVEALSGELRSPLSDPFREECVIVQSRGMARYISLETARQNGISALMDYLYPNGFTEKYLGGFCNARKNQDEGSLYGPERLCWKIYARLPGFLEQHSFPELKGYIGGDDGALKRFQLSLKVGDLFDQYLLFRPDMIKAWEKGEGDDWQAVLWRMIRSETEDAHRVDLLTGFAEKARTRNIPEDHFPERISIFGISALPSFYMDMFHTVSHYSAVHLYLLNPCGEYWGDILSERERARVRRKNTVLDQEMLYLDSGNRLLGSMGRIGRDFFDLIHQYGGRENDLFQSPGRDSLLSWIKDDIFQLKDPGDAGYIRRNIGDSDMSIQIHAAHSPLREVEILNDRIYAMLDSDRTLKPRDILVMMTSNDTYAPLVHSVFGRKPQERDMIPYSVADMGFARESRVAGVFMSMLDLKSKRFTVGEVMDLLEEEELRSAFDIGEGDLDVISGWISQANIRWGWDGKDRRRYDLPEFEDCSWMAGIRRLLLGYAMPDADFFLYEGIAPVDCLEGKQGELLGSFMDFAESLYTWVRKLDQPRPPDTWAEHLLQGIDRFFKTTDSHERDLDTLKETVKTMAAAAMDAGLTEDLDFTVLRYHLGKVLEGKEQNQGFITGGVTFCAMLPMRSIPFRVICILGMNANDYPRRNASPGFDLMVKHPRPGDRSRRDDDRYLFLEALISARDTFYISYTGRSIRDNSAVQPSVLVSELTDYIEAGFDCGGTDVKTRLILEHPLQPFSPRYFDRDHRLDKGPGLFSFSTDNYQAALAGLATNHDVKPFFDGNIGMENLENLCVDVADFCRFFKHPARYLLEKRLGIVLEASEDSVCETEPFDVTGLEGYALRSRLMEGLADGADRDLYNWARATGSLPQGRKGEVLFREIRWEAQSLVRAVHDVIKGSERKREPVDVEACGIRIRGIVDDLYDRRLVRFRPSGIGAKDELEAWVRHVILCAFRPEADRTPSYVLGLDRSKPEPFTGFRFEPLENPEAVLAELASIFVRGQTYPVRFFPKSSKAWYEVFRKGKDPEAALRSALKVWESNIFSPVEGEGEDGWNTLCFKGLSPFDPPFPELSEKVYSAVFEHRVKISGEGAA